MHDTSAERARYNAHTRARLIRDGSLHRKALFFYCLVLLCAWQAKAKAPLKYDFRVGGSNLKGFRHQEKHMGNANARGMSLSDIDIRPDATIPDRPRLRRDELRDSVAAHLRQRLPTTLGDARRGLNFTSPPSR